MGNGGSGMDLGRNLVFIYTCAVMRFGADS